MTNKNNNSNNNNDSDNDIYHITQSVSTEQNLSVCQYKNFPSYIHIFPYFKLEFHRDRI